MSRRRRQRSAGAPRAMTARVAQSQDRELARAADAKPPRQTAIDVLRGLAIVAMVAYHLAFDLRYFRITQSDFEHDGFWLTARSLILSSFLLLAGLSLVLADRRGASPRHFWMHVGRIAACALLVSLASYLMFPQTFIWFGVLHAIAVSLVLAQAFVRRPTLAFGAGLAVIAAGTALSNPIFDGRTLGWVGFMTHKPATEDYVPLFPWAGVMLVGIPLGHVLARGQFAGLAVLDRAPRALSWLGRHSLIVYLVHQPILIGALWLVTRL